MSNRSISWNTALRDVRDDRAKIPAGLLAAKARIDLTVRLTRRPLFVAGNFDRAAIMAAAISAARAYQEWFGGTWADAMSVCLTASWHPMDRQRALHQRRVGADAVRVGRWVGSGEPYPPDA